MISSMAGVYGFGGEAVYCATKFAQVGFAQPLDRELRPHGIKVGVICPGGVKTEFALGRGRTQEGVSNSVCWSPKTWLARFYWPANNPRVRGSLKSKCAPWQNPPLEGDVRRNDPWYQKETRPGRYRPLPSVPRDQSSYYSRLHCYC